MKNSELQAGKTYHFTLVLLQKPGHVLLPKKPKGKKLVSGKRNGYGGRQEKGETLRFCACRETHEESGVTIKEKDLALLAIIDCYNECEGGGEALCRVYVYGTFVFYGQARSTPDMEDPRWFKNGRLPLKNMSPDGGMWMSRVLKGERLHVEIHYGPRQQFIKGKPKITTLNNNDLLELHA
jgi:8-oxo-dGTP pyrophosphatase MutT (NUDIX family)